jgi:Fic family protein
VAVGLLERPTLYLSDFFEKNKALYYDNLTFVRTSDKLAQWIKFFLVAVIETSDKGIHVFREILRLRDEIEGEKLLSLGTRIQNGKILISHLYKKPIINVKEVEEILGLTTKPANRIVQDFVDLGILKEVTGYKRNRLFLFEEYYKLFADG